VLAVVVLLSAGEKCAGASRLPHKRRLLLTNVANLLAVPLHVERADVSAVQHDSTRARVIEAQ
jgi:hypothetical protein